MAMAVEMDFFIESMNQRIEFEKFEEIYDRCPPLFTTQVKINVIEAFIWKRQFGELKEECDRAYSVWVKTRRFHPEINQDNEEKEKAAMMQLFRILRHVERRMQYRGFRV
jgi:hypothetical protein